MTDKKQERPRIEMVYIGRGTLSDDKVAWQFCEVLDVDKHKLGEPRAYTKTKGVTMPDIVGGVYSVEIGERDGDRLTLYPGTFRWVHHWDDEMQVQTWQANDRTLQASLDAKRMLKKAKAEGDELTKLLERLHVIYLGMNFAQRPAYLALVVNSVLRGT